MKQQLVFYRLLALLAVYLFVPSCILHSQEVPERLKTGYTPLDEKLATLVTADDNAISAEEAFSMEGAVFLDARDRKEYKVSHLPGALNVGYPLAEAIPQPLRTRPKDTPLVVYCTVGYRSERAAEKLREAGFTRVYNLYGSLYAWKLAGYDLLDNKGNKTERLHTYNRKWGSFIPDDLGTKVH